MEQNIEGHTNEADSQAGLLLDMNFKLSVRQCRPVSPSGSTSDDIELNDNRAGRSAVWGLPGSLAAVRNQVISGGRLFQASRPLLTAA
jgi:hypothetical protein